MGKTSGATQLFIEPIERRILLTVFAQDFSFQPTPAPPGLSATSDATPISKGRFIVPTYSGGGEDGGIVTYTRVFADGTPDRTFGQKGSLAFDEDDSDITFTGSRFIVTEADLTSASLSVYTINGKPDESVGDGTGSISIPFTPLAGSNWSVAEADLQHTYADGSMLIDAVIYSYARTADGNFPSNCQLLKLNADGTLDTTFGKDGIVNLPTGVSGTFRDLAVTSNAIYVHVLSTNAKDQFFEKLLRLTPGGKVDTNFGSDGQIDLGSQFEQYGEEPDGKLVILDNNISGDATLHRFNHDGTPDKTFGTSGTVTLRASSDLEGSADTVDQSSFYVDSQNRILVGEGGTIFRYNSSGKLDTYPFNGTVPFNGVGLSEDDHGRILTTSPLGIAERFAVLPAVQLDPNGIAHITGTTGNDSATVTRISNDRYQFVVNGQTFDLIAPKVREIDVNFFNGNNSIDIDSSVDASANVQTLGGDDTVTTSHGDDTIGTGAGSDTIDCGDGDDSIVVSDDLFAHGYAAPVTHHISGGTGNKSIMTESGTSFIDLGVGNSTLSLGPSLGDGATSDHVAIAGGSNSLTLYDDNDFVTIGGNGNNSIDVESGDQIHLTTGDGNDSISVNIAADATIHAGGGNDKIIANGEEPDTIYGEGGNDTIEAGGGNDYLSGGSGNDRLVGEAGNDTIIGGTDNDVLKGGAGNDYLSGQAGLDTLTGGGGTDTLVGG